MKSYKLIFALAALSAALTSCNDTTVKGSFSSVPANKTVVAKAVEGNTMRVLDTIKVSKDGSFRYKPQVAAGQPEFFYLYYGDTKIASLLLAKGDKVQVECDTLGTWTVSGSQECELLRQNEVELAAMAAMPTVTLRQYIEYYRKMTKYVLGNSHSLTVVPVLFSAIGDTPVFSQLSDAVVFNSIADSLETVYPDSKYVKALRNEGTLRQNQMELQAMISNARQASYVDLNFDGMEGKPVVLSEVAEKSKATLLVFWDSSEATNKMFNAEVLLPLYNKYASQGFNVYEVNVGSDKATWAMVVREQKLPWVNVCDVYGRSINVYGVDTVPTVMLLHNNTMDRLDKITPAALDAKVQAALK